MKVKIGNYIEWFGPYHLAEAICFWVPKKKDEFGYEEYPEWVDQFVDCAVVVVNGVNYAYVLIIISL